MAAMGGMAASLAHQLRTPLATAMLYTANLKREGLPEAEHAAWNKLKGMSGAEFDREFMNMMVQDHQDAVKEFQHESNMAQDYDVKMYANHVLPVLQKHLQKAQEVQGKISGGPNTR